MRTKDTLYQFEEIATLLQYLYASENHSIIVDNGLTNLQLRMTDELDILCKNLSFPDLPELNYTSSMTPDALLNIIYLLKTMPAIEFKDRFNNRWDEIREITLHILAFNKER